MTSRLGWLQSLRYLSCLVLLGLLQARSAHSATVNKEVASGGKQPVYEEDGERRIYGFCGVTPLFTDRTEYDKRCDLKASDPKWPCFDHSSGDLLVTKVEPWLDPLDMSQEVVLRDTDAKAFTPRNASDAFIIHYLGYDGAKLKYYDYEPQTGCYKIHLSGTPERRIYVSDGIGDDRDIDTEHYYETGKRLCSKRITIAVGHADDTWADLKDSDGRGI